MSEPKLNWKSSDYFNVADYERITENLNEVSTVWGVSEEAYPAVTYETYLLKPLFLMIAGQYNRLAAEINGFSLIETENRKNWFTWRELNEIERISTMWETEPLLDSTGEPVHDSENQAVYCKKKREED